ncbi:MAG: bifunctional YncE family protein/alkaline phosphatase family protein [Isosphaeraceae bacterium]
MRRSALLMAWFGGFCMAGLPALSRSQEPGPRGLEAAWPGLTKSGSVLLPNGWSLRPVGRQVNLGDFPITMAENPAEPVLAVLHAGYGEHEVITVDARTGKVIAHVAIPETYGGLAWSADGKQLFFGGGFDEVVYRFDHGAGLLSKKAILSILPGVAPVEREVLGDEPLPRAQRGADTPQGCVAGLALSKDGKALYVADAFAHRLVTIDLATGQVKSSREMPKDSYPYGVARDDERHRTYVSLWGAATVLAIDDADGKFTKIAVEEHPNEMLLAKGGKVLYVANANRNTVSVIDPEAGRAVETIGTAIHPQAPSGSTPNALALSPDESLLFVANANTNSVAAFNVAEPGKSLPLGFIPAGWYPTSVRVSKDGKALWIANGKGTTSKPNREGPTPGVNTPSVRDYIAGLFRGTLSIVPMPTPAQMAGYSRTVYECSPLSKDDPKAVAGPKAPADNPVPSKVGDPSPIKYCIYVVKENRTYDQVFGDMKKGNGEPKLCLFPEEVTPNHHALVDQFVVLDNFYVDGEVSADGHEWTMGAYATDFVERTWPISYRGDRRAPYPAEGKLPIAFPSGGYLWDKAKEKGVSYRSYGEFVDNGKTPDDPSTTKYETLQGHFDPKFRGYDLDYPDVKRAARFLEELKEFEEKGEMPRLIVIRLPNDHTAGTRPGAPTVRAMVADNDLALGMLVEGVSKSKFWKETAIFVIEDDAQNGPDHVDAHRTVALAISPYIKKGSVDSTMYSTSSMLRTMELILGLEPMSQFDAAARPMWAAFTDKPDLAPYVCKPARIDLNEKNTRQTVGAAASLKLNLDKEDQADDLAFNEIIWKAVRGTDSVMPAPVRAAFVIPRPKAEDDDDDEDDDDK